MPIKYTVTLTSEERQYLDDFTKTGKHASRSVILARALLLADEGEHSKTTFNTSEISSALGISDRTIERMKKRFVEEGVEAALERKPLDTSSRDKKYDGAFEARIIAMACSDPPEGRARWTVRLLAEKAVEMDIADTVSHMTVQRILKKTKLNLTEKSTGKSPRKAVVNS